MGRRVGCSFRDAQAVQDLQCWSQFLMSQRPELARLPARSRRRYIERRRLGDHGRHRLADRLAFPRYPLCGGYGCGPRAPDPVFAWLRQLAGDWLADLITASSCSAWRSVGRITMLTRVQYQADGQPAPAPGVATVVRDIRCRWRGWAGRLRSRHMDRDDGRMVN